MPGLAAWDVVPGPQDHVLLLARYPYILNDHDCFVGDARGAQFLSRDGGATWIEVPLADGFVEHATWVGDRLVAGVRPDGSVDAEHLVLIDGVVGDPTDVSVPREVDRVRVPGDPRPVAVLRYGAAIHGLATDGADVVVHAALHALRFTPTEAGLGDATVEAELTTGTGLLWNAVDDRPAAVTSAGIVARDLQTLVLID